MNYVASIFIALTTMLLVTLQAPSAQQRAQSVDADLAGTWMLVSIEQDLAGPTPRRVATPRGALVLDRHDQAAARRDRPRRGSTCAG